MMNLHIWVNLKYVHVFYGILQASQNIRCDEFSVVKLPDCYSASLVLAGKIEVFVMKMTP